MRKSLLFGLVWSLSACGDDPAASTDDDSSDDDIMVDEARDGAIDASRDGSTANRDGGARDAKSETPLDASPRLDGAADGARTRSDAAEDASESGDGALLDASDAGRGDASTTRDAGGDASTVDASLTKFDWGPGDYPPDLKAQRYLELKNLPGQSGKTRGFKVHVPKGYDASRPTPVVYALHGLQQNAVMFGVDGTGFVPKSDAEGFILVMPNGIQEDGFGGSWNAGACCGAASQQRLDDVGFIRAVHAEVSQHVNVDARRVYATGLSNGGFMSTRLGCEAADLFAAIAPLAGSIGTKELAAIGTNDDPDFKSCAPSRPIPVLAMHGDADGIVPYGGLKTSLDHFAKANGCSASTVPAMQPASGGDTTCVTYSGCPSGVEVTGCTVKAGGHCWFGDPGCGTGAPGIGNLFVGNNSNFLKATDAAWDFLKRFQR
jgi:polyhydroxybutyrate depolymerase